jgi:hypothetical protein
MTKHNINPRASNNPKPLSDSIDIVPIVHTNIMNIYINDWKARLKFYVAIRMIAKTNANDAPTALKVPHLK